MRLITLHGRKDPAEEMKDWGFNGPDIDGIVAVHSTYGNCNAFFTDPTAAQAAHRVTGWPFFDDHALEMAFHEDLLVLKPETGEAAYYGDFEFQDKAKSKPSEHAAKMRNLIGIIASMRKDGEDGFVMENDDAVDTINSLIGQARELTRQTEGGASAANKPTIGKICAACGSSDVRLNADVRWDPVAQEWNDVISLFDDASCEQCGGECDIEEVTLEGAAP